MDYAALTLLILARDLLHSINRRTFNSIVNYCNEQDKCTERNRKRIYRTWISSVVSFSSLISTDVLREEQLPPLSFNEDENAFLAFLPTFFTNDLAELLSITKHHTKSELTVFLYTLNEDSMELIMPSEKLILILLSVTEPREIFVNDISLTISRN